MRATMFSYKQTGNWIATGTVIVLLCLGLSACGKKADLFLPEENTQVNTQASKEQQSQSEKDSTKDKDAKKQLPATEN